jgi:hypothetical protein
MTQKVLFYAKRDARVPFNHSLPCKEACEQLGWNSGNILFTTAIQAYLDNAGTPYDVVPLTFEGPACDLHKDYSHCVVNCANWIRPAQKSLLIRLANKFRNSRVPVFFIGLGVQAESIGDFSFLDSIRHETQEFIRAILNTGGGFGLRGAFTAECFEKLGFRDYTITGCPSLYQGGPNLLIQKPEVEQTAFNPVINGSLYLSDRKFSQAFAQYGKSEFVCQDILYKALFCGSELSDAEKRNLLRHPEPVLQLLANDRIQLFTDLPPWLSYIRQRKFTFSFGNRIHGNVVPLLAGVPAFVHSFDSRTRELAEFFDIPHRDHLEFDQPDALWQLYQDVQFDAFNTTYPKRFSEFNHFIEKHSLPLQLPADPIDVPDSNVAIVGKADDTLKRFIREFLTFQPPGFSTRFRDKRWWFLVRSEVRRRLGIQSA